MTKQCSRCKQTKKLISEFYKRIASKDGKQPCCKKCFNASLRLYRQTEKGKKTYNDCNNKKYRKTKKGKLAHQLDQHHYYHRHPEKIKARNAVNRAIKTGKLPHPNTLKCTYCPKQAEQYHHHKGYAPQNRLDVVSVCKNCHKNKFLVGRKKRDNINDIGAYVTP